MQVKPARSSAKRSALRPPLESLKAPASVHATTGFPRALPPAANRSHGRKGEMILDASDAQGGPASSTLSAQGNDMRAMSAREMMLLKGMYVGADNASDKRPDVF